MKSPIEWIKELHTSSGKVFEHFPKLASVGESDVLAIQKDATRRPDEIISFLSSVIKSGELERDRLQAQVMQLREALQVAINTVECASINPETKEELPWYKMAKSALSTPPPPVVSRAMQLEKGNK